MLKFLYPKKCKQHVCVKKTIETTHETSIQKFVVQAND